MKKVIDFLKSEVVIFLVLLICAGFVGADLYKLRVPCHTAKFNYDGDYPIVLLDDEKDAVAEMKEMLRR